MSSPSSTPGTRGEPAGSQPPLPMIDPPVGSGRPAPAYRLWLICAVAKIAIFLLAGRSYGYLSDELYFLDAAAHLAAGYVDFPPLIAWVMALLTTMGGNDLLLLRGFACLTGIAVTVLAIDITRVLGGRATAQRLTAIVVVLAPAFLSVQSILTMNVLDQLCWAAGFWLLIRYLQDRQPRHMLLLGTVFGVALLTKLAIAAWFGALGAAAIVYARWTLSRREVWAAIGITLILASPYLGWQLANDWPLLDFISAYNSQTAEAMVIDQPLFGLIATMNPPFLLIWLPGLLYGLLARDPIQRLLGTAAVLCLLLFLGGGVKFYFATPLFIIFSASGALLWERWLARRPWGRRAFLAGMALSGLTAIPIAAPVLPPAQLQQVADFIRDGEQGFPGNRPAPMGRYFPHFAEMHGWRELVEAVARQYDAIAPDERAGVTLVTAFFGQAGALNQLDREERLPTAHSGHMNYYLWLAGVPLTDVLFVGFEPEPLREFYAEVDVLEIFECQRCMDRENGLHILRARRPLVESDRIRANLRRYYFF